MDLADLANIVPWSARSCTAMRRASAASMPACGVDGAGDRRDQALSSGRSWRLLEEAREFAAKSRMRAAQSAIDRRPSCKR
jgi:hypothetical protein